MLILWIIAKSTGRNTIERLNQLFNESPNPRWRGFAIRAGTMFIEIHFIQLQIYPITLSLRHNLLRCYKHILRPEKPDLLQPGFDVCNLVFSNNCIAPKFYWLVVSPPKSIALFCFKLFY
jgi:hypothetical protein